MSQSGNFVGGSDDQDRLLDEATSVVKEQAYFMKRAIDNDNLKEALKHSSNLICELRTSLLSPKNYYELYMQVFQEMQHLAGFFGDKGRHGRKMVELYESVQHAGSILPRMYLLATVGASYIKSKEAAAKEILKDMNELCKGVQNPMRGLFLRYYLSQMVRDKLPDDGTEYAGEGGDINDAFEFIFTNFCESNRLWVRMQHQGAVKDKSKREKERHDLRVLVGSNLVRLSSLEGMTIDYYSDIALPKILDHITTVKDTMSQQYLFESMIQVFPDEFHIKTLEQVLAAYAKAAPTVDMKPIMVALMQRLANYLGNSDGAATGAPSQDIFALIRTHLQAILERALEPPPAGGAAPGQVEKKPDITAPLEVQAAFMQFTISLYPDKVHYVDIIMGSTVEILRKFHAMSSVQEKLGGNAADKVMDLLMAPMKSLGLRVLEMEHYTTLLGFLNFETRKQTSIQMAQAVVEANAGLNSVEAVQSLCGFMSPLIKDLPDTPPTEGNDKAAFEVEQQHVARLVHQIQVEDTDLEFQILTTMRSFFGEGGPQRMAQTLQPVYYRALALLGKIRTREELRRKRAEEGEELPPQNVTPKKVFGFLHKTNTALMSANAEVSLQLWLIGAAAADAQEQLAGNGSFEPISYEFLTQGLICFEENITDSARQFQGIFSMVGTMSKIANLESENLDNISQKIVQHAARLLKKPMQCRAVASCSHLYWCEARKDGKRVLECLQKCLKIVTAANQSDAKSVGLWVEMLDKYCYYHEMGCEEVTLGFVQSLLDVCAEHISFAEQDAASKEEAKKAREHLKNTARLLRHQQSSNSGRYGELSLEKVGAF